jgi:hypothetical protein
MQKSISAINGTSRILNIIAYTTVLHIHKVTEQSLPGDALQKSTEILCADVL